MFRKYTKCFYIFAKNKRFTIFFEIEELRSMGWEDMRNPRLNPGVEESRSLQGASAPENIMVKGLNK